MAIILPISSYEFFYDPCSNWPSVFVRLNEIALRRSHALHLGVSPMLCAGLALRVATICVS